jgi:UDP-N-acetylmuramate--alanine ligase
LLDDFAAVLSTVDVVLVTEVYAAGEVPIAGADGRAICRAIRTRERIEPVFCAKPEDLHASLAQLLRGDDVLVLMGAGHIGAVAQALPSQLMAGSDA